MAKFVILYVNLLLIVYTSAVKTTVEDVFKKAWTAAPNFVATFESSEDLLNNLNSSSIGTLAFVKNDETLALRTRHGWKYINLGSMVTRRPRFQTPTFRSPYLQLPPNYHRRTTQRPPNRVNLTRNGPGLVMAALNTPFSGNIGVKDADFECYKQAREANIPGTFRAFLASRFTNIASIVNVRDSRFPVVNTRGTVLYNSWRELFTGEGVPYDSSLEIYSFNGKNVMEDNLWPMKVIWHGGSNSGIRDANANCREWTSNNMTEVGKASVLRRHGLLGQEKYSCNNSFIILCIQVQRRLA